MHVGHFAVGLLAKRVEPKLSLGTLVLAAMLSDFLWAIFLLAGIEHVRLKPGRGAANYADAYDIAFSHSLLMDVVWGRSFCGGLFLTATIPARGTGALHRSGQPLAAGRCGA